MNTGHSLVSLDYIADIPYSGAVLLVFCFLMFLWRVLVLLSSALNIFPILLKRCFSSSEWEAAWPALSFKPNPRLFLKEGHRKRISLKPEGALLRPEGLHHGKLQLGGTLEIIYETSFSTGGNWCSPLVAGSELEPLPALLPQLHCLPGHVRGFSYSGQRQGWPIWEG